MYSPDTGASGYHHRHCRDAATATCSQPVAVWSVSPSDVLQTAGCHTLAGHGTDVMHQDELFLKRHQVKTQEHITIVKPGCSAKFLFPISCMYVCKYWVEMKSVPDTLGHSPKNLKSPGPETSVFSVWALLGVEIDITFVYNANVT